MQGPAQAACTGEVPVAGQTMQCHTREDVRNQPQSKMAGDRAKERVWMNTALLPFHKALAGAYTAGMILMQQLMPQ